jgi:hypothetical protein
MTTFPIKLENYIRTWLSFLIRRKNPIGSKRIFIAILLKMRIKKWHLYSPNLPAVTAQFNDEADCAVTDLLIPQSIPSGSVTLLKATTTRDVLNEYVSKKDILAKLLPHIDIEQTLGR